MSTKERNRKAAFDMVGRRAWTLVDVGKHLGYPTGIRLCLMAQEETTAACLRLLWQWVERYGIPKALYTDKKNVFVTNRPTTIEEQLAGEEPTTAFGKACAKLDIAIIPANSPQAKGRVERAHGVQQDRLVKELRPRGVTTIGGANEVMCGGFVGHLNEKFAKPPAVKEDAHRPMPARVKLAEVSSGVLLRVVQLRCHLCIPRPRRLSSSTPGRLAGGTWFRR